MLYSPIKVTFVWFRVHVANAFNWASSVITLRYTTNDHHLRPPFYGWTFHAYIHFHDLDKSIPSGLKRSEYNSRNRIRPSHREIFFIPSIFNSVTPFTEGARRAKRLLKCLTTEEVLCLFNSLHTNYNFPVWILLPSSITVGKPIVIQILDFHAAIHFLNTWGLQITRVYLPKEKAIIP